MKKRDGKKKRLGKYALFGERPFGLSKRRTI